MQIYPPPPPAERAFTLVELAIVLVIIGLLVGGVLVGKDLIQAASIRSQIRQVNEYRSAARAFQLKYKGLPGDLSLGKAQNSGFTISDCTGQKGRRDGNGIIEWNTWDSNMGSKEPQLFWSDLSQSGMIKSSYPSNGATDFGCTQTIPTTLTLTRDVTYIGNYLPEAEIAANHFVYIYFSNPVNANTLAANPHGDGRNWFGISMITSITNICTTSNPGMPVEDAYHLDHKTDDGNPITGSTRAQYVTCTGRVPIPSNNSAVGGSNSCYNSSTNEYSVSAAGRNPLCGISMRF